jgi:hypothetical protein
MTQHSLNDETGLTLQDIARSTLFDYEVRGNPKRHPLFYEFLKAYSSIFEQPWQMTPKIDECIARLASVDTANDDPDYVSIVSEIRYDMTDAFYSANKLFMDNICAVYRQFVRAKQEEGG